MGTVVPDLDGEQPVDNVSGFTLKQIQSALNNSRFPNTWRDNLKRVKPTSVSTSQLDQLFEYVNGALNNPGACVGI